MARKPTPTLTDGELKIMEVLWEREEGTVRAVVDALAGDRAVAYSTVQTMLGILCEKGFADYRKEGRAFVYAPLVGRQEARRTALRHMLRQFFGGSSTALAQSLLDEQEIDLIELERLQQRVRQAGKAGMPGEATKAGKTATVTKRARKARRGSR